MGIVHDELVYVHEFADYDTRDDVLRSWTPKPKSKPKSKTTLFERREGIRVGLSWIPIGIAGQIIRVVHRMHVIKLLLLLLLLLVYPWDRLV